MTDCPDCELPMQHYDDDDLLRDGYYECLECNRLWMKDERGCWVSSVNYLTLVSYYRNFISYHEGTK